MIQLAEQLCDSHTCARPGCGPLAGCQGHAWRELAQDRYRDRLELLVKCAAQDGYTVTVEQRPLQPLAMGHTEAVVTVRESRASYRGK